MHSNLLENISQHKELGNKHFKNQNYDEALSMYSYCITSLEDALRKKNNFDIVKELAKIYSNRSKTWMLRGIKNKAFEDAKRAIELLPDFWRPYHRMLEIYKEKKLHNDLCRVVVDCLKKCLNKIENQHVFLLLKELLTTQYNFMEQGMSIKKSDVRNFVDPKILNEIPYAGDQWCLIANEILKEACGKVGAIEPWAQLTILFIGLKDGTLNKVLPSMMTQLANSLPVHGGLDFVIKLSDITIICLLQHGMSIKCLFNSTDSFLIDVIYRANKLDKTRLLHWLLDETTVMDYVKSAVCHVGGGGKTALIAAASCDNIGNLEEQEWLLRRLIALGAEPYHEDAKGRTAASLLPNKCAALRKYLVLSADELLQRVDTTIARVTKPGSTSNAEKVRSALQSLLILNPAVKHHYAEIEANESRAQLRQVFSKFYALQAYYKMLLVQKATDAKASTDREVIQNYLTRSLRLEPRNPLAAFCSGRVLDLFDVPCLEEDGARARRALAVGLAAILSCTNDCDSHERALIEVAAAAVPCAFELLGKPLQVSLNASCPVSWHTSPQVKAVSGWNALRKNLFRAIAFSESLRALLRPQEILRGWLQAEPAWKYWAALHLALQGGTQLKRPRPHRYNNGFLVLSEDAAKSSKLNVHGLLLAAAAGAPHNMWPRFGKSVLLALLKSGLPLSSLSGSTLGSTPAHCCISLAMLTDGDLALWDVLVEREPKVVTQADGKGDTVLHLLAQLITKYQPNCLHSVAILEGLCIRPLDKRPNSLSKNKARLLASDLLPNAACHVERMFLKSFELLDKVDKNSRKPDFEHSMKQLQKTLKDHLTKDKESVELESRVSNFVEHIFFHFHSKTANSSCESKSTAPSVPPVSSANVLPQLQLPSVNHVPRPAINGECQPCWNMWQKALLGLSQGVGKQRLVSFLKIVVDLLNKDGHVGYVEADDQHRDLLFVLLPVVRSVFEEGLDGGSIPADLLRHSLVLVYLVAELLSHKREGWRGVHALLERHHELAATHEWLPISSESQLNLQRTLSLIAIQKSNAEGSVMPCEWHAMLLYQHAQETRLAASVSLEHFLVCSYALGDTKRRESLLFLLIEYGAVLVPKACFVAALSTQHFTDLSSLLRVPLCAEAVADDILMEAIREVANPQFKYDCLLLFTLDLALHKEPGMMNLLEQLLNLWLSSPHKYTKLEPCNQRCTATGDTLLHVAARGPTNRQNLHAVQLLTDARWNLNPNTLNSENRTVLECLGGKKRDMRRDYIIQLAKAFGPPVERKNFKLQFDDSAASTEINSTLDTHSNARQLNAHEECLCEVARLVEALDNDAIAKMTDKSQQLLQTLRSDDNERCSSGDALILEEMDECENDTEQETENDECVQTPLPLSQKYEAMLEGTHDDVQGFENLTWEVECTEMFWKHVRHNSVPYRVRTAMAYALNILASGLWNKEFCQRLPALSGIILYQTPLLDGYWFLWQVTVVFSHRRSASGTMFAEQGIPGGRIYAQTIRLWALVCSLQQLRTHVRNVARSHERGEQSSVRRMLRGLPVEKTSKKRHCPRLYSEVSSNQQQQQTCHSSSTDDIVHFTPAASFRANEFHIMKFYSMNDSMLKVLQQTSFDVSCKFDFPFKVAEMEHEIIMLATEPPAPILLMGRSGTGKTTCCLYRLFDKYCQYWSQTSEQNPLLQRTLLYQRRQDVTSSTDAATEDEEEVHWCPHGTRVAVGHVIPLCCRSVTQQQACASTWSFEHQDPSQQLSDELQYDHLQQLFVTKNTVLLNEVKRTFSDLHKGSFFSTNEVARSDVPHRLQDLTNKHFPLFCTMRHLLLMLDGSLPKPHFFYRSKDGGLSRLLQGWKDPDAALDFLPDPDREEVEDVLLDNDEEMIQEEDDNAENISGARDQRNSTSSDSSMQLDPRVEVTYEVFATQIWSQLGSTKTLHPCLVWTEILSFIKGSIEALTSVDGFLSREDYVHLGRKRAPMFNADRDKIYDLFLEYQHFLSQHLQYDLCDVVVRVYRRLPADVTEWAIHELYVDETQDFTQAELCLLLRLCRDPNRMFFTGDTAQSIARGVSFRFEDLRSLFYYASNEQRAVGKAIPVEVPRQVFKLLHNYRSHDGILAMAASVISLLVHFFPESFDQLPRDLGLFDGPKPFLIDSCSSADLAFLLQGNKRRTSNHIEFGAHQAIIVANEAARDNLPEELTIGIVLTIFEAKGLEFDDVLLYNFFTDSCKALTGGREWRAVTAYLNELVARKMENVNASGDAKKVTDHIKEEEQLVARIDVDTLSSSHERPHPLRFDAELHKVLNGELKQLYTALTRARVNVWIFDENAQARQPMFEYFQAFGLVRMLDSTSAIPGFAVTSTPQQWRRQGDKFFRRGFYELAGKCYDRCGDATLFGLCIAHVRAMQVVRFGQTMSNLARQQQFLLTARDYMRVGFLKYAALSLQNAKQFDLSAQLYRKLGQERRAARIYLTLGKHTEAAELLESVGDYAAAVRILANAEIWQKAVAARVRMDRVGVSGTSTTPTLRSLAHRGAHASVKKGDFVTLDSMLEHLSIEDRVAFLSANKLWKQAAQELKQAGRAAEGAKLLFSAGDNFVRDALEMAEHLDEPLLRYDCYLVLAEVAQDNAATTLALTSALREATNTHDERLQTICHLKLGRHRLSLTHLEHAFNGARKQGNLVLLAVILETVLTNDKLLFDGAAANRRHNWFRELCHSARALCQLIVIVGKAQLGQQLSPMDLRAYSDLFEWYGFVEVYGNSSTLEVRNTGFPDAKRLINHKMEVDGIRMNQKASRVKGYQRDLCLQLLQADLERQADCLKHLQHKLLRDFFDCCPCPWTQYHAKCEFRYHQNNLTTTEAVADAVTSAGFLLRFEDLQVHHEFALREVQKEQEFVRPPYLVALPQTKWVSVTRQIYAVLTKFNRDQNSVFYKNFVQLLKPHAISLTYLLETFLKERTLKPSPDLTEQDFPDLLALSKSLTTSTRPTRPTTVSECGGPPELEQFEVNKLFCGVCKVCFYEEEEASQVQQETFDDHVNSLYHKKRVTKFQIYSQLFVDIRKESVRLNNWLEDAQRNSPAQTENVGCCNDWTTFKADCQRLSKDLRDLEMWDSRIRRDCAWLRLSEGARKLEAIKCFAIHLDLSKSELFEKLNEIQQQSSVSENIEDELLLEKSGTDEVDMIEMFRTDGCTNKGRNMHNQQREKSKRARTAGYGYINNFDKPQRHVPNLPPRLLRLQQQQQQ